MFSLLDQLNPEQRAAAETTEGPVLILAGAGTGKTRAITFRMANLIANGTPAESILAVTFTNKAAQEMRTRVADFLLKAGVPPATPWLSTFHSLCARLLRREAAAARTPQDFAIYDTDDQLSAVKLAMGKLENRSEELTPRNVLSAISHAKNHAKTPEKLRSEAIAPTAAKSPTFSPNTNANSKQQRARFRRPLPPHCANAAPKPIRPRKMASPLPISPR